MIIEI
ncbi:hypothetical protein V3C99_001513 [Haemonchus contortus]